MLKAYWVYLLKAKGATLLHSPFVFELYQKVIKSSQFYYAFSELENLRQKLLENPQKISVQDYGAGSQHLSQRVRAVKDIAAYSLSSSKQAQMFFRLVNYFEPKVILETGTSLGLTTLYLALPNSQSEVITLEGCPQIAQLARNHFNNLKASNIRVVEGKIEETLPIILNENRKLDFIFLDANHRLKPTLQYFEWCLPYIHAETVLVIDDIHWSEEMNQAWQTIQKYSEVSITIDLFVCGLVFFKKNQAKQDFILKF